MGHDGAHGLQEPAGACLVGGQPRTQLADEHAQRHARAVDERRKCCADGRQLGKQVLGNLVVGGLAELIDESVEVAVVAVLKQPAHHTRCKQDHTARGSVNGSSYATGVLLSCGNDNTPLTECPFRRAI